MNYLNNTLVHAEKKLNLHYYLQELLYGASEGKTVVFK